MAVYRFERVDAHGGLFVELLVGICHLSPESRLVAELALAQLSVIVTLSILWVTVGGTPLVLPSSLILSTTLMPEVT